MMHVIAGLFLIAFGVWGVMDEWYYALDFLKAAGSLTLTAAGILALLGGVFGERRPDPNDAEADPASTDTPEDGADVGANDWNADVLAK
jgi:hypothetical protein